MESEQELLQRIQKEFDNSAGTLTLTILEFTYFFHLTETEATKVIKKLLLTGHYEIQKELNNTTEEQIERIQLKECYVRNYWLKAELDEKEAYTLLEIGKMINTPFNTGIKHITIKDNRLIKLDLRNQQLSTLPERINAFSHLQELRLQNNSLTKLPETIGELTRLKILDLDNNSLRSLPESIGELKELEELWVRNNSLKNLPKSLKNLKKLQFCSLQGNIAIPEALQPKIIPPPKQNKGIISKPKSSRKQDREYLLKICCVGSVTNIKTEFIRRYVENKYVRSDLPILGVDITTKRITINKTPVKLIIVNTAGYEFFGKLRPSYYRGASALIILFDKGDFNSFQDVPKWIEEYRNHTYNSIPESIKQKYYPHPPQQALAPEILVGLITDSEQVSAEEAQALAAQLDISYFECSPKNGKKINKIFELLVRQVIEENPNYQRRWWLRITMQIRLWIRRTFVRRKKS